ncbi:ATP-dependent sacrificial sulfur transferase LarE [Aquihabitans daechungensis]|uniref:ATP-dependent sacrificial sulfur transferase LarE n=1 Tax=Aquihabitans daechungensis TaxID=1052257 RepID=UPI003BA2F14F
MTTLGDSPAPSSVLPVDLAAAYHRLRAEVADLGSALVAFSGGADSALVAWVAHDVLGPARATAVTAVSASLAGDEHADCRTLAAEWGLTWQVVATGELADPRYVANEGDRCYWCKTALLDALAPLAAASDATVVLGVNVDDLGDHRPGQQAAAERGARFPLVDAGFTKAMVREVSRHLGLRTADKPAAACLASRIPYGTPVTVGVLAEVEAAEAALRALGFDELRVRHYRDLARLEVPVDDLAEVVARRTEVVEAVRRAGYRYVTLDLEGFRSGNLNSALRGGSATERS